MITVLFCVALFPLLTWVLICNLPKKAKDLRDEVILITGAGSGLGRLISVEISKYCGNIIGWDKNMEDLKETAELVFQANKIRMHLEHIDLSFPDGIRDCASKLHMTYGRVTIVISNAGVVNGKYLLDLAGEDVERVFKVNFFAAFHLIKAFLPGMLGSIFEETYERIPAPLRTSQPLSAVSKAPPHGRFIFTSSITGQIPCLGLSDYCASKAALSILAESFRLELIRLGVGDKITITDIRPYVIDTGMFDGFKSRFPRIFPVQTKEATVARIIKAIREREYIVYIPWSMTLFPIIKQSNSPIYLRFFWSHYGNGQLYWAEYKNFVARTVEGYNGDISRDENYSAFSNCSH